MPAHTSGLGETFVAFLEYLFIYFVFAESIVRDKSYRYLVLFFSDFVIANFYLY